VFSGPGFVSRVSRIVFSFKLDHVGVRSKRRGIRRKKRTEGTGFAERDGLAAKMFAGMHDEGVEFVENLLIGRKAALEENAQMVVRLIGRSELVALEDAARIGVNNEDRMTTGIKEDGVGGFRPDAVDGKQLLAQFLRGNAEHAGERARVVFPNKVCEGFQFASFLPKVAGGTNEAGKASNGNVFHGAKREKSFAAKIRNSTLHVGPGGILGKDGADNDFKAGAAWPPALRAMYGEERFVISF